MKGIVFLDRDGTLIEEVGYLRDPSDVRILPGAAELALLSREGYLLAVVSNQAGWRGGNSPARRWRRSTGRSLRHSGRRG